MSAVVLRPSRLRIALRGLFGLPLTAAGTAIAVSGGWGGLFLVALGLLLLIIWAEMALGQAYEVHIDDDGFRVHNLRGHVVHDVAWREVASLDLVHISAGEWGYGSVAFTCDPRRPKRGRLRWVRGTRHDDGCLPEKYRVDAVEILDLMQRRWLPSGTTTFTFSQVVSFVEPTA